MPRVPPGPVESVGPAAHDGHHAESAPGKRASVKTLIVDSQVPLDLVALGGVAGRPARSTGPSSHLFATDERVVPFPGRVPHTRERCSRGAPVHCPPGAPMSRTVNSFAGARTPTPVHVSRNAPAGNSVTPPHAGRGTEVRP